MENGAHFSGDKLSLTNNNSTLIRRGEDKGVNYEVTYQKSTDKLPDRCANMKD